MELLVEPGLSLARVDETFHMDKFPRLFRAYRKSIHGLTEVVKANGLGSDVYDLSFYKNKPDMSIGPRMRFRAQMSHQCATGSQYVTDSIS